MSEPDAVPLPREGEVFFDVRGDARTMRLSWYADSSVAVFSIWQGHRCTGTFRLPFADLVRMVETLQSGPPSRTADAISRLSADPSATNAGHDRGFGYGEPTGYLPAASYGHQPGYESGRGYESRRGYESGRGYESRRGYESEPGYESGRYESGRGYESAPRHGSEPIYGAGSAYPSEPGYGVTHRQPTGRPGSHQVRGPYQGYADQAGYPDSARNPESGGYPPTADYGERAGYADYRPSYPDEDEVRPSYRADRGLQDFPAAPASADSEPSDWDAATASYRAR